MKTLRRTRAPGRIVAERPHRFLAALATACLAISGTPADAQSDTANTPYVITDRGPFWRTMQRTIAVTNTETGEVSQQLQGWTELGDGMHFWSTDGAQGGSGQWLESQDVIELTSSGAQAIQGAMKASFSGDPASPASPGAISLTTAAGQVFQSHPLGLYYSDPTSGQVVQLAQVQSSQGLLYPPNVIVWTNAFLGLQADLVVVWARNGFEQNIVLKESPPAPEAFGLSSASCRLQAWTAMDQCPVPVEQRLATLPSGLADHIIFFSDSWLPVGAAFAVGTGPLPPPGAAAEVRPVSPSDPGKIPTAKSLVQVGGQMVLVEEARLADLLLAFKGLSQAGPPAGQPKAVAFADRDQLLQRPAPLSRQSAPIQLAAGPYRARGVWLDYQQLSGSVSSFTFTNGCTYYIPGSFSVGSGTATFQTNACIKLGTNAYLLVSGPVSFPASGPSVVFTSQDDNAYTDILTNSTSEPGYAAAEALYMYYQTVPTVVQNALFRWAQRGIQYDGGTYDPWVSNCVFQTSSVGVYANIYNNTLHLRGVSECNVSNAIQQFGESPPVDGSMTADCGTPTLLSLADASQLLGGEGEPAIAVNPANPLNLFVVANHWTNIPGRFTNLSSYVVTNLFAAYSMDGGSTWTNSPLTNSYADPSAAFDRFGNLFCCYIQPGYTNVVVLLSTNGGRSFDRTLTNWTEASLGFDQPVVTTGPGGAQAPSAVWITFYDFGSSNVVVSGAAVTNLGAVGPWTNFVHLTNTYKCRCGRTAVGPTGQVAVVFQLDTNYTIPTTDYNGPTELLMTLNPAGLGGTNPGPSHVLTSQAGFGYLPPAAPNRWSDAEAGLAWDRTGGAYRGRLYLVYTDRPYTNQLTNMQIYAVYSTDNGSSWSSPRHVNDDWTTNTNTKFDPRIAVDQTSGLVAVSWYDCRRDTNNVATTFYAAVSTDGGQSFGANLALESRPSNATVTTVQTFDYFDYTGLAFYGGYFYAAWADNSTSLTNNPNATNAMDIYVSRVQAAWPRP